MTTFHHAFRIVAGGLAGAGMASVANAATVPSPSFGPPEIVAFGYPIPILSALFGVIGVGLARRVAPASAAGAKLGRTGNLALTLLLMLGIVALVVAGERRPIVALGWAIGLGYSGIGFVELVARSVVAGARIIIDGFVSTATKGAARWQVFRGEEP